jgi:hypothetical protein
LAESALAIVVLLSAHTSGWSGYVKYNNANDKPLLLAPESILRFGTS